MIYNIVRSHTSLSTSVKPKSTPPISQPNVTERLYEYMHSQVHTLGVVFLRPAHIIRGYQVSYLRPDLIAALTVAVIMLPQAIAFALIAELPPQFGLYTAIFASIIGGLWGSSHQLQTGPTNTISILTLSALLTVAAPGSPEYAQAARILAIMVGLFALFLGIARLGVLVNFVSDSVIVGFTAGAGILIIVGQLRHLLGLSIRSYPELLETLKALGVNLTEAHWISLGIGLLTIFIILVLRRINPKIPGSLIAIVFASLLVGIFGLRELDVKSVAELPKGLPPVLPFPRLEPQLIAQLSTKALAVAAIALVESMSIARVISSHTRQRLDSNQEFVGQGLANIGSGILSGYPAAGSFTRTAVNYQAGARTSLASVFAGLLVLASVLTLGGLVTYIPLAALAGVLILTAIRLINFKEISSIWQGSKGDRLIMLVTFTATITIPLEFAVLIGVGMSLVYYLLQTSTPRVRAVLPDESYEYLVPTEGRNPCPQLGVVEILGDLYFGAVFHVEDCIHTNLQKNPSQRYLLLRVQSVENIDISGIHALEGIVENYRERGGDVFFERYRDPVLEVMQSSGFYDYLGQDHFIPREEDALGYLFYKVLDPAICIYECPVRAFKECQNLPKRIDLLGESLHIEQSHVEINTISAEELWKDLCSGKTPLVIDVREPREFKGGHVPNAKLIPLPEILSDSSPVPHDERVILVCRSGRRSTRVACVLTERGYNNVIILKGGMLNWEATNLLEAIDV
jgi:SulP family sulfate permease